jgi:diguanylate cyclase (GGDEF)-like protein
MPESIENKKNYIGKLYQSGEEKLIHLLTDQFELLDEMIVLTENKNSLELGWFYRLIINLLTSLEMEEQEARNHYFRILENKYYLSEKMGRDIGIRVAALDYFQNIIKSLKNPKIMEISFFEQILKLSKEDPKTGCYNSKFISEFIVKEIKKAKRHRLKLSLIMTDIDDFKSVNDNFGHLAGDKVLKEFCGILSKSARDEDIIARFGGDEFMVVLPQTNREGARCFAERTIAGCKKYFEGKKEMTDKVNITFSCGIATYPDDALEYEGLVKAADNALYSAKRLGKNKICCNPENKTSLVS